jgi:hypothetical protein
LSLQAFRPFQTSRDRIERMLQTIHKPHTSALILVYVSSKTTQYEIKQKNKSTKSGRPTSY